MNRRSLLVGSGLTAAQLANSSPGLGVIGNLLGAKTPTSLLGNRFVTFCIMIRTTPWEVSRDVKLMDRDESSWHTLDGVRSMREAFARHNPEGRLTWGFTLNAL